MKRHYGLWLLFVSGCLLLSAAVVSGCMPNTKAPQLKATITPSPVGAGIEQSSPPTSNPGAAVAPVAFTDTACLNCHTSQNILKGMTSGVQAENASPAAAWSVVSAPQEPWQKIWIDPEKYSSDVHALINCTACHGGQAVSDPKAAHTGLIADPSAKPEATCGTCHTDIAPAASKSLHYTLAGFDTALHARSSPGHFDALAQAQSANCQSCHATCGSCHVNQPAPAGGGLLNGHAFVKTPAMSQTCLNCHEATVGKEYTGLNEGVPADVHYALADMTCTDCHSGDQMHGIGQAADTVSLHQGAPEPKCETCHADQIGVGSNVLLHQIHGTEILPCQACHSVDYTNCTNCHENTDGTYTLQASSPGFYLARNPERTADRPWRYVPVRHVPVDVNSFDQFGSDLLDNFLSRPTWAYTSPHNIQLDTPQTQSCTSCHGNNNLFLTADKVSEAERSGANLNLIVDTAPPLPDNWMQVMAQIAEGGSIIPTPAGTWTNYWGNPTPVPTNVSGSSSYWGGGPTLTPVSGAGGGTPTPTSGSSGGFWSSTATPTSSSSGGFWGSSEATNTPGAPNTPNAPTSTPIPPATSTESAGFWGGSSTPTPTTSGSFWGK